MKFNIFQMIGESFFRESWGTKEFLDTKFKL